MSPSPLLLLYVSCFCCLIVPTSSSKIIPGRGCGSITEIKDVIDEITSEYDEQILLDHACSLVNNEEALNNFLSSKPGELI